ncbi:MAG TPA: TetR/AcrR family transcriptional regulator [Acidimicrobiia bacterium]|nr:TetR/AcrR family transcriptional regulator [Acidimicrobiia bacterium]
MGAEPPGSGPTRREAILDAALELFRERGFHSVGIDEIGTAAGISGPGVYRHFESKGALLVALFDSITERMLMAAEEIQKADAPPDEVLGRLVAFQVATAVEERSLLAVWIQEWRSLPQTDQQRIRRKQMEYTTIWVGALSRLRPELSPAQAEAVVHAALGAINSVALHDAGLAADEITATLVGAARAVLATT